MSASNMVKMLDSVGAKYKVEKNGDNVCIKYPVPDGDYNVELLFCNKGEDFFSAVISFDDEALKEIKPTQVNSSPTSNSDDYTAIVQMVKTSPYHKGEWQEAKSQDGKYIGLLYQDYDCQYGVAFVCLASTRQFLAVVGF
jgi:hypothetical protein